MDLGRFLRVAWRFRALLAIGLVLATVVATLSFVRVGSDGVSPRENNTWVTASTLLVTQEGFPWGRAILDDMIEVGGGDGNTEPALVPKFSDPGRYSGLAAIYAELAKGDAVQRRAMRGSGPGEFYESSPVMPPGQTTALPMIYVKGYGPSPEAAVAMAGRASKAFIHYLDKQQAASGIPESKRVEVVVTQTASAPELFAKRSIVRPVMLFLLISMVFLAIAFGLENLRPTSRRASAEPTDESLGQVQGIWPAERKPASAGGAGRRSA
jgi:hypothetical protein